MWIDFLTGANSIYFADGDSVVSIDFGRNPDIKSVHFTDIQVGIRHDAEVPELKWLTHFLSDIGQSSRVEEVKVDVVIADNAVDWSPWEGVDHVLTGTNFRYLRKVDIEISDMTNGSGETDWYTVHCRALAASLPLLQGRGILGDIT